MQKDMTINELEELHEKTGATIEINDGEIQKISKGKAPEEKEEVPAFKRDEIEAMLNNLERKERLYLLSRIDWRERMESLAEKMFNDTQALDVIYLRAKAVRQC